MKLTSERFKDCIYSYRLIPIEVIKTFGYSVDDLPTEPRKKAFYKTLVPQKAIGTWLRYSLFNENELLFELKSKLYKDFRPMAIEKQKLYELMRAIDLSDLTAKLFPPYHSEYNAEGLFMLHEWQLCQVGLQNSGILGNKPKTNYSKTANYEITQLMHEYLENPRPGRLFQKTDTGKFVDIRSLEEHQFDARKIVIRESIEKPYSLEESTNSSEELTRIYNSVRSQSQTYENFVLNLGEILLVHGDKYVLQSMDEYTSASKKSYRTLMNKEYLPIFVIDDVLRIDNGKRKLLRNVTRK